MGVPPREILEPLEGKRVIFHNVPFDLAFLLQNGVRLRQPNCTQLLYAALTHDPMVSLAKACKEVLGVEVPKEQQTSDWCRSDLNFEQIRYAARDAVLAVDLCRTLAQRLKNQRAVRGFKMVRRCIPAIADAQARGVLLGRERHGALVKVWTEERDATLGALQGVLGEGVNPESPSQLSKWLETGLDAETRESWPTRRRAS
jgi:DNA polymerase I-like protein with 3'-5' exonuclease and polymerase domains